jgi:hypothetical protein
MSQDRKPPEGQITPEEVASQFMVLRTHDNRVAVQFPTKGDGNIDGLEALKLIATGLNFVVDTLHQQQLAEVDINPILDINLKKPRIVLAPAIPKEFLTKGKL